MTGSPPELASGLYRPTHGASRIRTAPPGRIPQQPGEKVVQSPEIPPDFAEITGADTGLVLFGNKSQERVAAGLSDKKRLGSMHRLVVGAASELTEYYQRARRRYRVAFITTTYSGVDDWRPNHISRLMQHYRDWAARRGFKLRGVWVMEMQQRGAPHYHLLLWLPRGVTPPKPDKQGWWPHGSTNCKWARKAVNYVAKYTSKIKSKEQPMPKGARIYAVFGCPTHLGWWRAPGWLRNLSEQRQHIVRGVKGWWCNRTKAWACRSPWVLDYLSGGVAYLSWRGFSTGDVMSLWQYEKQVLEPEQKRLSSLS